MNDIEYINCEPLSEDWHRARAGCITASKAGEICKKVGGLDEKQMVYVKAILAGHPEKVAMEFAGYKAAPTSNTVKRAIAGEPVGDFSDWAKDLAFRLAVERITGAPLDDDEFSPWQAARGQRLEPEARAAHEVQAGVMVMSMGFIRTTDGKFGVSVDGLIGDDEGSEYKAFLAPSKLRRIILDGDWSDVMAQAQFAMAVTGRKRWHLGMYCPQLAVINRALTLHVVERDEEFIDGMWKTLLEFDRLIEANRARLIGKPQVQVNAEPESPPWKAAPATPKVDVTVPAF